MSPMPERHEDREEVVAVSSASASPGRSPLDGPGVVSIDIPCDPRLVALVRSAATAVASTLDIGIDRLDDLRLAVDEACSLLMTVAPPSESVRSRMSASNGTFAMAARARTDGALPARNGFAWTVLTALVDSVDLRAEGSDAVLTLTLSTAVEPA